MNAKRPNTVGVNASHQAIAAGMVWVASLLLLGILAQAAREVAIAYRYGISEQVDAYQVVFTLVRWPVSVWFSVLFAVLVPRLARIRQDRSADLPRFRAELFGQSIVLALVLGILGWVGLPRLLNANALALPPSTASLAVDMVPLLGFLAPLGVVTSLFTVWTIAAGRHANTLLESVPALTVLMTLLVIPGAGIAPLVWGSVAGFALHLVLISGRVATLGQWVSPTLARRSTHWPEFLNAFGVMVMAQAVMSCTVIVDQAFAARLPTGSIATLGYMNQLLAAIASVGGIAVSRATMPVFSGVLAEDKTQLLSVAIKWTGLLFALGFAVCVVGVLFARWGVQLVFERGAFTPADTANVAEVLSYGLLQLPFYFSGLVLVSLLASKGQYRTIAAIAAANCLVKLGMNFVLAERFGLNGIAMSTSVMYVVSLFLCWFAVRRTIGSS